MTMTPSFKRKRKFRILAWVMGFLLFGFVIHITLSTVNVMTGTLEDTNEVILIQKIDSETTVESEYLHSVEKCPIIEKYTLNNQYEMVLQESWNCSFGAGIATEPPPGAKGRLEPGYYVIDQINQMLPSIDFHPVPIAEQTLTIDGVKWFIYKPPFAGKTFTLTTTKKARIVYWWHRIGLSHT